MQIYIYNKADKEVTNIVFSDEERKTIKDIREQLITIQLQLSITDNKFKWNKNDQEALYEILEWPLMFQYGGTMRDLNTEQIAKIEKMLIKLVGPTTFADYFNIYADEDYCIGETISHTDMRKEMDRRRQIQSNTKHLVKNHIDELFDLN